MYTKPPLMESIDENSDLETDATSPPLAQGLLRQSRLEFRHAPNFRRNFLAMTRLESGCNVYIFHRKPPSPQRHCEEVAAGDFGRKENTIRNRRSNLINDYIS